MWPDAGHRGRAGPVTGLGHRHHRRLGHPAATAADEPVSAPLGELANVGADPTALAGYVLDNAVPAPEEPAP